MPGRTSYPTGENLEAFLLEAGFSTTFVASLDLELWALAGWQAWEGSANRKMLATTQTRRFDPRRVTPMGFLDFRGDLVAVTSAAFGTTSFTEDTDFHLVPLDAAAFGQPYFGMHFGHWRRFWASTWPLGPLISITGSWGYGATIPDDAFVGMLAAAALELSPQVIQARTGGLEAWTEADMSERYGSNPMQSLMTGWSGAVQRSAGGWNDKGVFVAGRYTRQPMG